MYKWLQNFYPLLFQRKINIKSLLASLKTFNNFKKISESSMKFLFGFPLLSFAAAIRKLGFSQLVSNFHKSNQKLHIRVSPQKTAKNCENQQRSFTRRNFFLVFRTFKKVFIS
jgi:hypothetical protein